MHNQRVSLRFR